MGSASAPSAAATTARAASRWERPRDALLLKPLERFIGMLVQGAPVSRSARSEIALYRSASPAEDCGEG